MRRFPPAAEQAAHPMSGPRRRPRELRKSSVIRGDFDRTTHIIRPLRFPVRFNGTITRSVDGLDRLTQETTPQGTVNYTYDADSRRATMTVAGQSAVSYGYDNAHRLTSITQGSSTVSLTYDNADRRSTLTFPNGIVATYGYDTANQLTSLTYTLGQTTLGDLTYTYDAAGHRTSVGGSWARTALPSALTSATYDAANRIAIWSGTSFSYDLNGNLTSDGLTSYTWNARNQLTGLSGGTSASFAYDGVGRRRSKTVGGATTQFLYDDLNLAQELAAGGTPTANLLTGLLVDETFTRTDNGGTSTLLIDALGSTLELADASGTPQTHYTFDPFGNTTASGATSSNALQFTGRENDGNSLYFYRARYYSSIDQRFIGEDPFLQRSSPRCVGVGSAAGANDPIALTRRGSQGLNLYSLVENNPILYRDPLGLDKCKNETGCPCNQHLEEDWGCFAALTLFGSPFYITLGLIGVGGLSHGNIPVGVITAALASGVLVMTHRICMHCVENKQ